MKIQIDAESLAMLLAQKKIEKKYDNLGFSPYEEIIEEFNGARYKPAAEIDYHKHYNYFLKIILSKELVNQD